jgi:hypothetical protein
VSPVAAPPPAPEPRETEVEVEFSPRFLRELAQRRRVGLADAEERAQLRAHRLGVSLNG